MNYIQCAYGVVSIKLKELMEVSSSKLLTRLDEDTHQVTTTSSEYEVVAFKQIHSFRRKRKPHHLREYSCLCFFNLDLCCGWYKPKVVYIKVILVLTFFQCFLFFLYLSLFMLTPEEQLGTDITYFFAYFNPFLVDNEHYQVNIKIIRRMMILSVPQIIMIAVLANYGFTTW